MGRLAAGAALLVAVVGFVYRAAIGSYFFNDDFQWMQGAAQFTPAGLLRLEQYDHFYRPVIEIYFYGGRALFGCSALPFHLTSVGLHLLNTLVLFAFARTLASSVPFAAAAAVLFAVQPGYVEAVAWIGAITDLLPALWYLLTLWIHLLFLRRGGARLYAAMLATFAACLLTHESAATLLPMMAALDATLARQDGIRINRRMLARRAALYAPFAALLAGFLAIAFIVNSRSYLVREGYYALGWHAVQNAFDYVVGLYVGKRNLLSYLAIAVVVVALIVRGTPRVRFFVVWMFVTLSPVLFFTWGTASRYLYVAAAGFALLLAEMVAWLQRAAAARIDRRTATLLVAALTLGLATRFVVFATKGSEDFRDRTLPYERFARALRAADAAPAPGAVVQVDAAAVQGIPEIYIDPAAQVIYCIPGIHVVVR